MMFIIGNIFLLGALALIPMNIRLVYRHIKYGDRDSGIPIIATFLIIGGVQVAYPKFMGDWVSLVLVGALLADFGSWISAVYVCRRWLGRGQDTK